MSEKNNILMLASWAFYVGNTHLGFLDREDVSLIVDANLIEIFVQQFGAVPLKVFTPGPETTLTLTLSETHKSKLAKIFSWLTIKNPDPNSPLSGTIKGEGRPGDTLPDLTLTGYPYFFDTTDPGAGAKFYTDALGNPMGLQIKNAFSSEAWEVVFAVEDATKYPVTFKALANPADEQYSPFEIGSDITLPEPGLIAISVTAGGTGYTSKPAVVVGEEWQATTAYTLNEQVFFDDRLYTVTTAGTTASTAPTDTSGNAFSDGTAELTYAGPAGKAEAFLKNGAVDYASITKYGSGYLVAPLVTFVGGAGSGATATAYIDI